MNLCNKFLRRKGWFSFGLAVLLFLHGVAANGNSGSEVERERIVKEQVERTLWQKPEAITAADMCSDQSPPQVFSCKPYYHKSTQRLAHGTHLNAGEAVCHNQYMFGVTADGIFQWKDCSKNKSIEFYKGDSADIYFVLEEDASWNIYEKGTDKLLWKQECNLDVSLYPQCLAHVNLDCPYIHLRKSGRIVLNSIGKDGVWDASSAPKVYDLWDDDE